jgi:hypothetical protein
MPYQIINGISTWIPWTQSLVQASNSVSAQTALIKSSLGVLPWLWPVLTFGLYLLLFVAYSESPGRFKAVGIATIVFVIAIVEAVTGLYTDAVLNFIVLFVAWILSGLFKS